MFGETREKNYCNFLLPNDHSYMIIMAIKGTGKNGQKKNWCFVWLGDWRPDEADGRNRPGGWVLVWLFFCFNRKQQLLLNVLLMLFEFV